AAGGWATSTVVSPAVPWYDAVICAVPVSCPVTTPADETVATDGRSEDHVAWLVTSCSEPSLRRAIAVSCSVPPGASDRAPPPLPMFTACTATADGDPPPSGVTVV